MPRFLVVITDFVTGSLAAEEEILGDLADVVAVNGFSEADLADYLPTAAALMVYHNLSITRASIEKLAQCKVIVRCGVGIDNVDGRYARERGIPFVNVPDYGTEDVADSAIGMALALARDHAAELATSRRPGRVALHASGPFAAIARPGVWHRWAGPHRHGHGAVRESAGNGCRVL